MFKMFRTYMLLIAATGLLACGDSETPQEKVSATPATETAVQMPDKVAVAETVQELSEEASSIVEETAVAIEKTTEQVVNQAEEAVDETVAEVKEQAEAAVSSDKPYQLVDGKISENAIEGWKTFNGGGCGACHGKGAIGAVGPNLGNSVTTKLTEEQFKDVVTNGRSGTMMRAHNTNKRVMDNLDNLYAYLVARGDDVLGPGNLIKFPLGKE